MAHAGVPRDEDLDAQVRAARARSHRSAVSRDDREERIWLLDGEPRDDARNGSRTAGTPMTGSDGRGCADFSAGSRSGATRLTSASCSHAIAASSPAPPAAAPSSNPRRSTCGSKAMTIAEVGRLAVRELKLWLEQLGGQARAAQRAGVVLRELKSRVGYLDEVGLGYLTVERQARTLSGGEAQRIHLASALGSLLTGTLYALDEPTVGLHAGDVRRLLGVLRHLRDLGNTVVVVEHDPMMIAGADFVVELGPGGGREGGSLVRAGAARRAPRQGAGASVAKRRATATTPGRVL